MNWCLRPLVAFASLCAGLFVTLAALALLSTDAAARSSRPDSRHDPAKKTHEAKREHHARSAAVEKRRRARHADDERKSAHKAPQHDEADAPQLSCDLAAIKDAIALARKGKTVDATELENKITDPAGQKLVEWFILRHPETSANFSRYAAFISANPDWPSIALLRRSEEHTSELQSQ